VGGRACNWKEGISRNGTREKGNDSAKEIRKYIKKHRSKQGIRCRK
jgi:hypothetical protein